MARELRYGAAPSPGSMWGGWDLDPCGRAPLPVLCRERLPVYERDPSPRGCTPSCLQLPTGGSTVSSVGGIFPNTLELNVRSRLLLSRLQAWLRVEGLISFAKSILFLELAMTAPKRPGASGGPPLRFSANEMANNLPLPNIWRSKRLKLLGDLNGRWVDRPSGSLFCLDL